jgi:hypothetical protein
MNSNHKLKTITIPMKRILIACLLSVSLFVPGLVLQGADQTPAATAPAKPAARAKQMPFRGKVSEIDKTTRTISLAGKEQARKFLVTATSKIHLDGKVMRFEDVKAGLMVGGLARENEAGQWEIMTLNLGVKGGQAKPEEPDLNERPE